MALLAKSAHFGKDLCAHSDFDGEARCCACLDKTHVKLGRGLQYEPHSQRVGATCMLR